VNGTRYLDLQQDFGRFDLLQLVRTLLRTAAGEGRTPHPDRVLRFRADLGAAFPGSNATALDLQEDRASITTPDFCVGSVLGPLPEAFLEWMRDLERAGQSGMRDFLDLFNHRINLLRYRVRSELEPGLHNGPPEHTLEGHWLAALMGIGSQAHASQIPLRTRAWLGIGELLANNRRSADAVVQVVSAYLRCPVRLEPLVPQWRPIGFENEQGLGHRRLGVDAWVGRSVWDVQGAIRLFAGPLGFRDVIALLPPAHPPVRTEAVAADPLCARDLQRRWRGRQLAMAGGDASQAPTPHEALSSLLRLLLDRRQDVDLRLAVREREIPPSLLTATPAAGQAGLLLGRTAWLKARRRGRDGPPRRGPRARLRVVRLALPAFPQEAS